MNCPIALPKPKKDRRARRWLARSRARSIPAIRRLRAYLADTYLPQARSTIGATETPGGEAYYAYRIAEMTTLPLTAEEVHRLGLVGSRAHQ